MGLDSDGRDPKTAFAADYTVRVRNQRIEPASAVLIQIKEPLVAAQAADMEGARTHPPLAAIVVLNPWREEFALGPNRGVDADRRQQKHRHRDPLRSSLYHLIRPFVIEPHVPTVSSPQINWPRL